MNRKKRKILDDMLDQSIHMVDHMGDPIMTEDGDRFYSEQSVIRIAKEYAQEMVKHHLIKAAYGAELKINTGRSPYIDKKSIINTKIELA